MKYLQKILIAAVIIGLLYLLYGVLQGNTIRYEQKDRAIDSLKNKISVIDSLHKKQDSVVVLYKDSVIFVKKQVSEEKEKYTKIKRKYDEIHILVANYTVNQLDSFFAERYGH